MIVRAVFWGSLGALGWTHAGYPLAMGALARIRPRPVRKAEQTPSVALVVSAHNEESVIRRRVENALALDYPAERLEVVVASDGSTDLTDAIVGEIAAENPRVRLLQCPREGKVAAQHRAVRETSSEVLAFTDANSEWEPGALRALVRNLADDEVGYVCGQLRLESPDGANMEGAYWRYEMWVREQESAASSITAGNGAIYAVKHDAYVEDDPKFGHDFGFPYLMEQMGLRAVYEPEAVAIEKPAAEPEDEYGRKVRTISRALGHILTGRAFRPTRPLYLAQLVSHRVLRYSTGILHVGLLVSNLHARRARALLSRLPRLPARRARARRSRQGTAARSWRAARLLLLRRHEGDGRGARALPALRHPADVGQGQGHAMNRAADVAIAGVGLALTSPLIGLAALAAKLEDRGPVLYRQTRVGKDGEDFEVLKLRTMVVGAERMGAGYAVDRGDRRITRVGRILRRTSIDELPQLWNILRGDMSVIGPRPTLRYQVEQYDEHQRHRLDIRPGLTGWAQVHGRAELPWAERIELDVWYVENRSPRVDLEILLRTPLALFRGTYRGATGGWRQGS